MSSRQTSSDALYDLLQHTYFDGIDNADAEKAVEAFNEDAEWVHTQVWEHDGLGQLVGDIQGTTT